ELLPARRLREADGLTVRQGGQVADDDRLRAVDRGPATPHARDAAGVVGLAGVAVRVRDAAADNLDPLLVSDARADLRADGAAFVGGPDERLVAAVGESAARQRPDVGALDRHGGVGVHPRQDLAVGVRQVNLGAEGPGLDVQRPRRAGDGPLDRLVAV